MGIPSYFVHVVKNHSNIIKKFENDTIDIQNLYIDSNSIIYDGIRLIEYNNDNDAFERKLITLVCEKILYYITLIQPSNRVLIAFDGVAPVAKLEQQRNRRYKTWYTNNYISDSSQHDDNNIIQPKWDTTAITPGTKFMDKLCKGVTQYFNEKNLKKTKSIIKNRKDLEIIISGSNYCGEGEHKIYKYIRQNASYHADTNTIIYGLDADLIMLTLLHIKISENLYLFRETPHFITSIDKSLVPEDHYVLDIYELSEKLNEEMTNTNPVPVGVTARPPATVSSTNDYIFMCFFLGNDFMPHFPALNIRTNGITILLETYNFLFGKNKEVLVDDKKIHWKNLRKFVQELAKTEETYCVDEMKQRAKLEKRTKQNSGRFKTVEEKLMACPMYDRTVEKYINIGDDGWQERYYKELFGIEINDVRRKQICINYLEGLEWNFKYYTNDCPDWKWKYNYKYPPLLEDLWKYVPYFDTEFVTEKPENPVKPFVQLSYVLPRNSLHLLPNKIYEQLILNHPDWYRLDYDILWAYCKYFWESHIVMPHIDIDVLDKLVGETPTPP